jgi:hypothetical protein
VYECKIYKENYFYFNLALILKSTIWEKEQCSRIKKETKILPTLHYYQVYWHSDRHQTHIWDISSLNPSLDYFDWDFPMTFLHAARQILGQYFKIGHNHIPIHDLIFIHCLAEKGNNQCVVCWKVVNWISVLLTFSCIPAPEVVGGRERHKAFQTKISFISKSTQNLRN